MLHLSYVFQVKYIMKDVMSNLQQTSLEKTLLAWCRQSTHGWVFTFTFSHLMVRTPGGLLTMLKIKK